MTATKSLEILPGFQLETLPRKKPAYPLQVKMVRWGFGTLGRVFPAQAARLAYRLFATPRVRAVHKSSDDILESARLFELLYGKIILKCYEWGSGDKTVLLVHGWESRGTAMRSFVPGLVAAGFRVVTFDGPAHGNSGGKQTNLPDFAGAVRAVIKQIGQVHGIITHSFGGATSVYAMAHLDPSIEIEKLVLIAVPASTQKVVREAMKVMNLPPVAQERFRKMMHAKVDNIPLSETDLHHALGKARVQEVLVVHDKFDESVPFESAELVFERWDHVSMLVTQGYGHFRLMKRPEVIERVTRFVGGIG